MRRILVTLLLTVGALTVLSGCGAPTADASAGTASVAIASGR